MRHLNISPTYMYSGVFTLSINGSWFLSWESNEVATSRGGVVWPLAFSP